MNKPFQLNFKTVVQFLLIVERERKRERGECTCYSTCADVQMSKDDM